MPAKQDLRDRTTGKGMEKKTQQEWIEGPIHTLGQFTRLAAPESSVVADTRKVVLNTLAHMGVWLGTYWFWIAKCRHILYARN